MTAADTVRRLLSRAPAEALCDACLAFACATSLTEMRSATDALITSDRAFQRGSSCASCRRTVPTIYRVVDLNRLEDRRAAAS